MKNITVAGLIAAPLLVFALAMPSAAADPAPTTCSDGATTTSSTAKCKDGTYSKSAHRRGTCSSHGGVAEWLTAAQ